MTSGSKGSPQFGFRVSLHLAVALALTLLVACVVVALTLSAYKGAERALGAATDDAIAHAASVLDERIGRIFEPADNQLRLLALSGFASASTLAERLALQPLAREVLAGNPIVQAVYAGYPDGDFVLFRPLSSAEQEERFAAPREADLLVQTISHGNASGAAGEYRFYARDGRLLETRALPDYVFDPRTRPWYSSAIMSGETILTEPYLFFTTRAAGVTLARRGGSGDAVVGLDAEFANLAARIEELRMTPASELAIIEASGTVIAHYDALRMLIPDSGDRFRLAHVDELGLPVLAQAYRLEAGSAGRHAITIDGRDWQLVRMPLLPIGSLELSALLAIPEDEMFAEAREIVTNQLLIAMAIFLISVPFGLWLTSQTVASLRRLSDETRAIESFDFSERPPLHSHIIEIDQLAVATGRMRKTISDFLDTNVALGLEHDVGALLETILVTVIEASRARGGAIYRLVDEGHLARVRLRGSADMEDALPLEIAAGSYGLVAVAVTQRSTAIEAMNGDLRVATPLITRDGDLVGAIVVWLPQASAKDGPRRDSRVGFIEALSSSAAVAIETRELIEQQKNLLESFIQLMAAAIDAKSPYTGGHCQRVPALAKMLADAAHAVDHGPLADFRLSEVDREALHIGAWLHDCGKITTPEHIVDKATKLECIHDRIHEIRMRFEVLKRDARIAALEARLADEDVAAVDAGLAAVLSELDEDFAFVASCNLGSEAMDDASIARLEAIATRRWQRTLDDRIGISREEAARRSAEPPPGLPAEESLLTDAPWHRVPRPESERFGTDNPWGFAMDVPELKHDFGELHNLTVRRGTLTAEDRYIINHHMIQTIIMLSRLPFPRHLANVPEIAGGHHERMDGKGYPRRLKRDEMSILARGMAVADVFEALTAADRPYKSAKTLSESVTIMARMVADHHLDPDLFRLFLESGIHMAYAERFLEPAQIDTVDVEAMLVMARSSSV